MRLVAVLFLSLALASTARAAECPTRDHWPTEGWRSRVSEVATEKAAQVKALEDYAFTTIGTDEERRGIRTEAVLVVHHGQVVYERYARGFHADRKHLAWSVTKSFMNALAGIGSARGLLAEGDSICKHLPQVRKENCDVTIGHLLDFSSGLDWKEVYENESNQQSSVLAMLYGLGRSDMAGFISSHDKRDAPGTTFAYSSGDTTLLAAVLDAAYRKSFDEAWPWTVLFEPIGMKKVALERDGAGRAVGSSYLYTTARDLAKFGYLFQNDGCWSGTRLLPEGWVAASTSVTAAFKAKPLYTDPGDVQGRQFWLNRPVPEQDVAKPWPDVPETAYAARGHWGQSMTVFPDEDVIVVRFADDRESGAFDFNRFLSLALAVTR